MAPEHPSSRTIGARAARLISPLAALSTAARDESIDLVVVISITAAAMVCILADGSVAARTVFAVPLTLVLPGYAVVAATFSRFTLGRAERLLMSLGVSLALTALAGIALNWTPWGLTRTSWSLLLGAVTLGASVMALLVRARWPEQPGRARGIAHFDLNAGQGILLGLAIMTLFAAVLIARNGAAKQPGDGFTQLWIQPVSTGNQSWTVRIGAKNMEASTETYALSVTEGGQVVTGWSFELKPDQQWEVTTVVPVRQRANTPVPVEAVLFRRDAPQTAYRYVILWPSK